jgi:hypothetical protein
MGFKRQCCLLALVWLQCAARNQWWKLIDMLSALWVVWHS